MGWRGRGETIFIRAHAHLDALLLHQLALQKITAILLLAFKPFKIETDNVQSVIIQQGQHESKKNNLCI